METGLGLGELKTMNGPLISEDDQTGKYNVRRHIVIEAYQGRKKAPVLRLELVSLRREETRLAPMDHSYDQKHVTMAVDNILCGTFSFSEERTATFVHMEMRWTAQLTSTVHLVRD